VGEQEDAAHFHKPKKHQRERRGNQDDGIEKEELEVDLEAGSGLRFVINY